MKKILILLGCLVLFSCGGNNTNETSQNMSGSGNNEVASVQNSSDIIKVEVETQDNDNTNISGTFSAIPSQENPTDAGQELSALN